MKERIFHIETLSNQGCGVAKINDKKFIIPFTLPGEEVEAEPLATKKNLTFCRLVRIIRSSPKRISPRCRYFGQCGGCDLQHMSYQDQLTFKQEWIENCLRNGQRSTVNGLRVSPIIPSPLPFNYRNRITLHSDGKRAGYYKPFSHEIVPIERCEIASEKVNEKINNISSVGANPCIRPSLETNRRADTQVRPYEIREDNHSHFMQVNSSQNANLIQTVMNFCSKKKWTSVLELYCGAGNLTFDLAKICKKITAVDLDAEAIRLANMRRHELKKSNIKFSATSAHDMVFNLAQDLQQFDLIVCDPPREGLKETATLLPRLKPEQIIYVSCNPQTFLNDVKILEYSGYKLTDIVPIDMFPQTYHVEVVGKLQRADT